MLDRLRDIERELGIAPQVARTLSAGIIREEVQGDSGDLTQVLPTTMTAPTTAVGDIDNATRLRTATKRRSKKGGWLMALVLLLAALAAGVGWWFGSGPGSQVAIADVSGRSFAEAQQILAEQSFQAVQKDVYDLDVAPGVVVGTEPGAGSRLDKDAHGRSARLAGPAAADRAGTGRSDGRRCPRHPAGDQCAGGRSRSGVLHGCRRGHGHLRRGQPARGRRPGGLHAGVHPLEGDTATLSVSLGPVPDVYGESVDSATAILADSGLSVAGTQEEFRDDLDAGQVVYIAEREGGGSWQPGESVTLVVSAGPPLFPVPDIVGLTRDQAKAALTDAGFEYEYATLWDAVLDEITEVESQVPAAGTQHAEGTVVSFRINGAF